MSEEHTFYLGGKVDPTSGKRGDQPLHYDPDDLTTHAVVVGMTGSGKTGLCIDLLEEAALNGYPALMIDPKGDITNTLLHFPELLPQDFQPWISADDARRSGQSVEQAAEETAARWRTGLQEWDIAPERLQRLKGAAHFAVYTPGSDAGLPISILASFKAPAIPWDENRELLREKISSTVTGLLSLVGMDDVDPVRSREHILLANIMENAWQQGRDLDLGQLILQTQTPPFQKLGVFDVEAFFPSKDRFELAMLLNNILAAPAFAAWIEGQPLDIPSLLYGPDGRPRHSVFYIAHLNDAERMFFVTLLYAAVETWMRTQSGTGSLRTLLYFDEIFGYLPPVGNPPSKPVMLRMLKQARAFGVGQVLVTQNPVDLDYKALSNTGSWFVGKLQTERDKQRLLDGLEGAMGGNLNRQEFDRLISSLGKRVFLLHNVHAKQPQVFQTRWAMNFLAGPLTRTQIPALNHLAGAKADSGAVSELAAPPFQADPASAVSVTATPGIVPKAAGVEAVELPGTSTRPTLPDSVEVYFLPNNQTLSQALQASGRQLSDQAEPLGLLYRPTLLAQAQVRFVQRKYNLETTLARTALVLEAERRGGVRWDEWLIKALDVDRLPREAAPGARFRLPEAPLNDARTLKSLGRDFQDWVYHQTQVAVRANESLKVYAGPEVSEQAFRQMCVDAARQERETEAAKLEESFEKKLDRVEERLRKEEQELQEDQEEYSHRKMEELGTHAETFLSLFSRRRRSLSSSMTKRRMTAKAKADVEESQEEIQQLQEELDDLEKELDAALQEVTERWEAVVDQVSEISVTPYKKDIFVELFGVAWTPYHLVRDGQKLVEFPGFQPG